MAEFHLHVACCDHTRILLCLETKLYHRAIALMYIVERVDIHILQHLSKAIHIDIYSLILQSISTDMLVFLVFAAMVYGNVHHTQYAIHNTPRTLICS